MVHSVRNLMAAVVTGVVAFLFMLLWMHTSPLSGAAFAAVLLVLVLAISGPSPGRDRAADDAWDQAAPDLPPFVERAEMEHDQDALPAPSPGETVDLTADGSQTAVSASTDDRFSQDPLG